MFKFTIIYIVPRRLHDNCLVKLMVESEESVLISDLSGSFPNFPSSMLLSSLWSLWRLYNRT